MHVIWRALTTFVRLVVARWNSAMWRRRAVSSAIRETGGKSGRAPRYRRDGQHSGTIRQRVGTRPMYRPTTRVRDDEVLRRLSVLRGGAELHRGRIVGGIRRSVAPPADDRAS